MNLDSKCQDLQAALDALTKCAQGEHSNRAYAFDRAVMALRTAASSLVWDGSEFAQAELTLLATATPGELVKRVKALLTESLAVLGPPPQNSAIVDSRPAAEIHIPAEIHANLPPLAKYALTASAAVRTGRSLIRRPGMANAESVDISGPVCPIIS